MKLYLTPGACSLAVPIAPREIGATFDSVAVDLAKHTTADGANYYDISPRGYVPLLQYVAAPGRMSQRPRVQDALRAEGLVK